MATVRGLLTRGNAKVGESIHLWSLPPVSTCPGASLACLNACYARQGRYLLPEVQARLAWNWEQAQRPDFVKRVSAEIVRKGCLVVRVHASGDFVTSVYAEKWLAVMQRRPEPTYYWYTRSWRVPEVVPVLEAMAALPCCRGWYSTDADTGDPPCVPAGVRLAYLQTGATDDPLGADLVFRVRGLRGRPHTSLTVICPSEAPRGRSREVTCGTCRRCFTG